VTFNEEFASLSPFRNPGLPILLPDVETNEKEQPMNLIPLGDYYVVYCDWCDSSNKVLWTRLETGNAYCGACHHPLLPTLKTDSPPHRPLLSPEHCLAAL
jgi:hypothetical protein